MPACVSRRRPVMPGKSPANGAPNRRPSSAMYSTAARAPAMPSKLRVPVSNWSLATPQLVGRQGIERLAAPVQHAHVRPEELVGRAGEEVGADRLDVDRQVRRGVDGVHERQAARLVGPVDELGDRVDGPDRVGRPAERDQLRALVEDGVEGLDVERDVVGADVHGPDDEPAVRGGAPPRPHVRLVVQRRHHDRVARLQRGGDGARQVHREGRHVRAELDLRGIRGVEQVREGRVRVLHDRVAAAGGQERAVVVGVRRPVVGGRPPR